MGSSCCPSTQIDLEPTSRRGIIVKENLSKVSSRGVSILQSFGAMNVIVSFLEPY